MPIRPETKWFYPIDWPQLSAVIRFERAHGRCERCRRPHGQKIYHLPDGRWSDLDAVVWRDGRGRRVRRLRPELWGAEQLRLLELPVEIPWRTTMVYIATAHLDQDPSNSAPSNLKALCQRCHLAHDRVAHQRQRWLTLFTRRALGDLFR